MWCMVVEECVLCYECSFDAINTVIIRSIWIVHDRQDKEMEMLGGNTESGTEAIAQPHLQSQAHTADE